VAQQSADITSNKVSAQTAQQLAASYNIGTIGSLPSFQYLLFFYHVISDRCAELMDGGLLLAEV